MFLSRAMPDYTRIRPAELLLVVMEDPRFRLLESLSCRQIIHQTMIRWSKDQRVTQLFLSKCLP